MGINEKTQIVNLKIIRKRKHERWPACNFKRRNKRYIYFRELMKNLKVSSFKITSFGKSEYNRYKHHRNFITVKFFMKL